MSTHESKLLIEVPVFERKNYSIDDAFHHYVKNQGPIHDEMMNHINGIISIIAAGNIDRNQFISTFAQACAKMESTHIYALTELFCLASQIQNQPSSQKCVRIVTEGTDGDAESIKERWGDSIEADSLYRKMTNSALAELVKKLPNVSIKMDTFERPKTTYAAIAAKSIIYEKPIHISEITNKNPDSNIPVDEFSTKLRSICRQFPNLNYQICYNNINKRYMEGKSPVYRTVICKFGEKCTNGISCTYAHSINEQAAFIDLYNLQSFDHNC